MNEDKVVNSLSNIFDKKDIELDPKNIINYSSDWSSQVPSKSIGVVFPRSSSQIIDTVKLCNDYNQAFIASGGRTGLSGGATVLNNELVISMERMDKILDFDENSKTVLCEPGLITKNLQDFAKKEDLFYPVDFSSSGSSQLGGNIATNAGGIKVVKYGMTGSYVNGITAVSGGGNALNFDKKLIKNATGPNQKNFFIGSEGIFGFITSARMRLIKPPQSTKVALIGMQKLENLNVVRDLIVGSNGIEAIEFQTKNCLNIVEHNFNLDLNIEKCEYYILIEYSNVKIERILEKLLTDNFIHDVLISDNENKKTNLWKCRLYISECINSNKPIKYDLAVPLSSFNSLVHRIEGFISKKPEITPYLFGHLGDGNLHANFINNTPENFVNVTNELNQFILATIKSLNGTISAEHGIGSLKKDLYKELHSNQEINTLKAIKNIYDPKNLLNPGKLI